MTLYILVTITANHIMRMRLSLTQSHRTKLCRVGLVVSLSTSHMVRPASVWNCVRGHALKISPGINRKRTVWYPGPVFLSSATLPLLPKKHYNELINQSINHRTKLASRQNSGL